MCVAAPSFGRTAHFELSVKHPPLSTRAYLYAFGAIALWSTLAALGLALKHVPPFLLVGVALTIGATVGVPRIREWRTSSRILLLGVYGLFGFHLLLFLALRTAPPVEANLINYLWPLLIVLLAPLFLPGHRLGTRHVVAAVLGFGGAALLITKGKLTFSTAGSVGYALAFASAFVWATYSVLTKRWGGFSTAAVGLFCLASGIAALACHWLFEPPYRITMADAWLWLPLGLGPMGAAFYLWDAALKQGDPRVIGSLAYLTPMLSTLVLTVVRREPIDAMTATAMILIVGAAALGARGQDDAQPSSAR
jgi:drug/metabolite transporter (DMT)-like permease